MGPSFWGEFVNPQTKNTGSFQAIFSDRWERSNSNDVISAVIDWLMIWKTGFLRHIKQSFFNALSIKLMNSFENLFKELTFKFKRYF
jgi:hypothetical protein